MGKDRILDIDPSAATIITYKQKIAALIEKLNSLSPDEYQIQVNAILHQIKETDHQFILNSGLNVTGHVLFSRHGESATWGQKKLGLNPNAALSEQAIDNMSHTNRSTAGLLHYPDNLTRIAVSPLVRAKQTASLLIPANLAKAQISLQPALSENSFTPSGNNITSLEQLKKEYAQMSFWQTPLKVIIFKLSIWFYGHSSIFEQIQKKSAQADETMLHVPGVTSQDYFSQGQLNNEGSYTFDTNSLSEDQKIRATRQLIRDNLKHGESDFWLFGHGNNFKSFFNKTFGIKSTFEYAETRSIYNTQKEPGVTSLFSPPYTFVIDQGTGRIRGKYTENTLAFEINPWTLTLISDSTKKMHERGLDLTKPRPSQVKQPKVEGEILEQPKTVTPTPKSAPGEENNSDAPGSTI
ncbi:histidine phosphatase family protein [Legionella maioricensis]|uniref:Histidine phosphatase family protein n=1 Tax=Legionella maioricensis TaxID=2896528 RepID=A0A9X2D3S1_9GAMM|nr:histidine phosphatase family protein [Legionella maioricensis]MCL9685062.1 histidine phosphatase family protein [Legionella maioricensis]MCL9688177.1 histidine phosphatase family protein [Legionella maioricensis]